MCGIVGGVINHDIGALLIDSLGLLEYRGYDSAGITLLTENSQLNTTKTTGKISRLKEKFSQSQMTQGSIGIAHTRWATHGSPHETNAHPICSDDIISMVHNGIIENAHLLKEKLSKTYTFHSETDSEVIAHLFRNYIDQYQDPITALRHTTCELEGSFATAILSKLHPNKLFFSCYHSPLVIAITDHGHYIASDHLALLHLSNQFIYLKPYQHGYITIDSVYIYSQDGSKIEPQIETVNIAPPQITQDISDHFMLKEIYEQPKIIQQQLNETNKQWNSSLLETLKDIDQIIIIGCGSSYHAGLTARYWIEACSTINVQVEIASELRYRECHHKDNTLILVLSQSGETADTISALKAITPKLTSLCITNNCHSTLTRLSDFTIVTPAGPEVGVASTKAYLSTLFCLYQLAMQLNCLHPGRQTLHDPKGLDAHIKQTLALHANIKQCASKISNYQHILFIGRHLCYPTVIEASLKLKEISYIHAEAYAGGELKHGPLALIDQSVATVALLAKDHLYEKMVSNINEIITRNGNVFIFTNAHSEPFDNNPLVETIRIPNCPTDLLPFVAAVALQLLAYDTASLKGCHIDQPRNLAKCVTVE